MIVLLFIALMIALVRRGPDDRFFAVSRGQSEITVEYLECLSVDRKNVVFDRNSYWDARLPDNIRDVLSIKRIVVDADHADCRWGLFATVVPEPLGHVRYRGLIARYLISMGICPRAVDGSLDPNRCVTRNVYVFRSNLQPNELFLIGLAGLAKHPKDQWEVFEGKWQQ